MRDNILTFESTLSWTEYTLYSVECTQLSTHISIEYTQLKYWSILEWLGIYMNFALKPTVLLKKSNDCVCVHVYVCL